MKTYRSVYIISLLSLLSLLIPTLNAQDEDVPLETEPVETYLALIVTYPSNDSVDLTANVYVRNGRTRIDLQNASIVFTVSNENELSEVGTGVTDSTGTTRIMVPLSPSLPADKQGIITYTASFEGTRRYLPSSGSFMSKPAKLEITFFEEDSVRYIRVTALQGTGSELLPAGEQTVSLFVPSLFRPLPIGEVSLDGEGSGTIEFPTTLVGDSAGNITVIARIDENELFGNIRGEATCGWAIPKHLLGQDRPTRELWTPVAPIWMIITLLIMLAGVWAHYIWAVIELIKIKKSSVKKKFEEKDWSNYS